jgi:hypothetical protein
MLYTVYLPIALIYLWSDSPQGSSRDRQRRVLKHTMSLVSAISIICRRTITDDLINGYLASYSEWVEGIAELYPHVSAVPNMHVSFHIHDFMKLFGPVRSWWTFPFERLIGQFQDRISNHMVGGKFIDMGCVYFLMLNRSNGGYHTRKLHSLFQPTPMDVPTRCPPSNQGHICFARTLVYT